MRASSIKARNDRLAQELGHKLDVPGDDLGKVVGRAGRALPRRLRTEARYMELAQTMAQHPKLYPLIDLRRVKQADRALRGHVRGRDPGKERTDRLLGQVAGVVFGLLVFFAALVAVLAWRGVIGPGG